jgi:RimJ/RimL family protein N-acetyltransferase
VIVTERLVLRQWRDSDVELFARMGTDPDVMEFFPGPMTYEASSGFAERIRTHIDETGWGLWAVEVPGVADFIGFVGLAVPRFDDTLTEVGWRLDKPYWGQGYASEGGRAALAYGFEELALDEIVSFTAHPNLRSQAVMQRIGMTRDPSRDFEHPMVPDGNWLKPHALYAITADQWRAQQ